MTLPDIHLIVYADETLLDDEQQVSDLQDRLMNTLYTFLEDLGLEELVVASHLEAAS